MFGALRVLRFSPVLLACSALGALGCSSGDAPLAATDAGATDAPLDASPADVTTADVDDAQSYPAAHPPLPLVAAPSGQPAHILAHPKIVTVVFPGDPLQARLEAFTDALGADPWWAAATQEYCTGVDGGACISPASVLAHVAIDTPPPATLDTAGVETYLQSLITAGKVPSPQADVVYTMFFPASVALGDPGFAGCVAFDGYHSTMMATPAPDPDAGAPDASSAPAVPVAYAVLARCTPSEGELTLATAHELIEAATDPDGTGYTETDIAWGAFFYSEVGDLCDFEPSQKIGAGFTVQSGWSNQAARAGKNPCVPSKPGELYFNAAPAQAQVRIKVGDSVTIPVMPYSEGPVDDWTLKVKDAALLYGTPPGYVSPVQLSLDTTAVNNGAQANLTIKLLRTPDTLQATGDPAVIVVLASERGVTQHFWPLYVLPK